MMVISENMNLKNQMQEQGVILERVVAENSELKSLVLEQGDAFQKPPCRQRGGPAIVWIN